MYDIISPVQSICKITQHNRGNNMNVEIDDNIVSGLLSYCNKNNIDFIKTVEESILQNQLRHNIDNEGNVYKNIDVQHLDKDLFKHFLKVVFDITDGNFKEALFGEIYENNLIQNDAYIIVEYKNCCKFVVITNDETMINQINNCKDLQNIKIEKNQAFCWVTTYHTNVLYAETENSKIILISACNIPQ
jgi:hypothetical protein